MADTLNDAFGFLDIPPISDRQLTARYVTTSELRRGSEGRITAYWADDGGHVELPSQTTRCERGEQALEEAA